MIYTGMTVAEFMATPPDIHPCGPTGDHCLWLAAINGTDWEHVMGCIIHDKDRAPVFGEPLSGFYYGAPSWYQADYKAQRTSKTSARAKQQAGNFSMDDYQLGLKHR